MTVNLRECEPLAKKYRAKAAAGLVDVKFYVRNTEEVLLAEVCAEDDRLDKALEEGNYVPLVFDDRHDSK